jgi:hypothetical protein
MSAPKNKLLEIEIMEKIIEDLYNTRPVVHTLKIHGVSPQSFYETLTAYPLIAEKYARAQSSRADLMADQVVDIADNEPDANKARNQMNARIWATGKMKPSVYGDKIQIDVNQTVSITAALEEANNRIRDIIQIPKVQIAESIDSIDSPATGNKPVETNEETIFDVEDLLK